MPLRKRKDVRPRGWKEEMPGRAFSFTTTCHSSPARPEFPACAADGACALLPSRTHRLCRRGESLVVCAWACTCVRLCMGVHAKRVLIHPSKGTWCLSAPVLVSHGCFRDAVTYLGKRSVDSTDVSGMCGRIESMKAMLFPFTSNDPLGRTIFQKMPFTVGTEAIKCVGMNLMKNLKL